MAALSPPPYRATRLALIASSVGMMGLGLSGLALLMSPRAALFGWLTALSFAVSICLGALVFLTAGHAMGAKWPVAVRRFPEAIVGALPLLALFFVVVVVGAPRIYIWADPHAQVAPEVARLLAHKRPYLNMTAFAIRACFYFLVWTGVAFLLRRWSFASDRDARNLERSTKARILSALALPLLGLTLTFAAFDWMMSLEPAWISAIYGIYWFSGGFVAALALVTLLAQRASSKGLLGDSSIGVSLFHALGRLLLAFSIFWAYIAFFQALLIQVADKPNEVVFYLERLKNGFGALLALVVLGRFIVPFFTLLPRASKRRPALLAILSVGLVVVHYMDMFWLIMPVAGERSALPTWIDGATLMAMVGLSVGFAAWRMNGRSLLPTGDPLFEKGMAYRSPQ